MVAFISIESQHEVSIVSLLKSTSHQDITSLRQIVTKEDAAAVLEL